MKTIFIIILLWCSYHIEAQQNKWTMNICYSPEINLSRATLIQSEETNYKMQQQTLNYTTGINTFYRIQKKLELGFGLQYATHDFSITENCNTCHAIYLKNKLVKQRYAEVPVLIRYNLVLKKTNLFIE